MKRNYISLSFTAIALTALMVLGGCGKEGTDDQGSGKTGGVNVPKVNTSLLVKHTGTLCPPCGGWGWTAFEEMMATSAGKAVFVQAYDQNFVSKLFITTTAEDWKKPLALTSWPSFIGNFVLQTARVGTGIDVAGTKANMANVANNHASAPVIVNSAYTATVSGDNVSISATTKFFEAVNDEFYFATYVVEDKVLGAQSGHPQTPNVYHHFVLRQAGPSFGTSLTSGSVAANKEFKTNVSIALDPTWIKSNLYTFTVIWKKIGNAYQFVNATPAKKLA